jgi:hypothetical protein
MLKRVVLSFSITAAAAVAFAFLFLRASTRVAFLGYDGARFLLATLLLIGAVWLFCHCFRWAEMILLGCAISLFLAQSVDLIIGFAAAHPGTWPWLTSQLFNLCAINPWVWKSAGVLRVIGLFFPLPLFAVVWKLLTPASNQSMELTASRRCI